MLLPIDRNAVVSRSSKSFRVAFNFILCATVAVISYSTAVAQILPSNADNTTSSPSLSSHDGNLSSLNLKVGDQLKLVVYESLQSEEDSLIRPNGQQGSAPRGFYLRPELTGEYTVGPDGMISLALLGQFPARGLTPSTVEAAIAHSYEGLVGKKGFVTILAIEHQPVFVTGLVKNPGSFKYFDGMTVLHAVAAAGGRPPQTLEPWQRVDIERQIERLKTGLSDLKRIAARTQVLALSRDGFTQGTGGQSALELSDDVRQDLISEQWQRHLAETATDAQKEVFERAVSNAKADLELRQTRVGAYDATIQSRQDRVSSIQILASNKVIDGSELTRAQSELSDFQDRKQQTLIDVANARQRLASATQELQQHSLQSKISDGKSLADAESGLTTALQTTNSDLNVFQAMVSAYDVGKDSQYEILRPSGDKLAVQPATDETILQPGDLIRVR